MGKRWSQEEITFVQDNAHKFTDRELARQLTDFSGREISFSYVRKLRQRLGLRKKPGRGVCLLEGDESVVVISEDAPPWEEGSNES